MLKFDLHIHTIQSLCGLHTYLEVMNEASRRGLHGIAITDHGGVLGGPGINKIFVERFPDKYKGLKIWKGIEANVLPDDGTDVPLELISKLDIVLLGFHENIPLGKSEEYYTRLLISSLQANPCVDVLVHPDMRSYPLNIKRIVDTAASLGIAIEFNNANIMYKRTNMDKLKELAQAVQKTGCRAIMSSDAHCISNIGEDKDIVKTLTTFGIQVPIINSTFESLCNFIEERRAKKGLA